MPAVPPPSAAREQIHAALRDLAVEVSAGELPDFLAKVERAKWTARLRVAAVRPPGTGGRSPPLLTAEQVAGRLQVWKPRSTGW